MGGIGWKRSFQDRGDTVSLGRLLTKEELALARKLPNDGQIDENEDEYGEETFKVLEPYKIMEDDSSEIGDDISVAVPPPIPVTERPDRQNANLRGLVQANTRPQDMYGNGRRANEDEEEEEQEGLPIANFASEIDDGSLQADILRSGEEVLILDPTRIVVRYRPQVPIRETPQPPPRDPPPAVSQRRKASDVADKTETRAQNTGQTVEAFLDHWSTENIQCRYTHKQAFEYCVRQEIPAGTFNSSPTWQNSKLNTEDENDRKLIQRIRRHLLSKKEDTYSTSVPDGVSSILQLKMELRNSAPDWDLDELSEYCGTLHLSPVGNRAELVRRITAYLTTEINDAKKRHKDTLQSRYSDHRGREVPILKEVATSKGVDDPTTWTKADFLAYFRANACPSWGNLSCLQERARRFRVMQRTKNYQHSRNTLPVNLRTDVNGWEAYVFKADINHTTVESLRSKLFIVGNFDPTDNLFLYFADDVNHELRDQVPLSTYAKKDWTTLHLDVRSSRVDLVGSWPKAAEEKKKTTVGKTIYRPPGAKIVGDILLTAQQLAAQEASDRALAIALEKGTKKRPAVVRERMTILQDKGAKLNDVTKPTGGRDTLRTGSNDYRSTSSLEILNNVEHLVERLVEQDTRPKKKPRHVEFINLKDSEEEEDEEEEDIQRQINLIDEAYRNLIGGRNQPISVSSSHAEVGVSRESIELYSDE